MCASSSSTRRRCGAPESAREKLQAALETGERWHAASTKIRISYGTVKKHSQTLGYEPRRHVGNPKTAGTGQLMIINAPDFIRFARATLRSKEKVFRPKPGNGDLLLIEVGSATGSAPAAPCHITLCPACSAWRHPCITSAAACRGREARPHERALILRPYRGRACREKGS